MVLQKCHRISVGRWSLLEVQKCFDVEPVQPNPFWAVVVAESMGCNIIVRVVVVVIVLTVQGLMHPIECAHTDRVIFDEPGTYQR